MPNIFITNRGSHDYSQAERFGTLVFMSDGSYSRFQTGRIYRRFEQFLATSKSDDLVLVSGLTVMTAIAVAMMAVKHGKVNLLLHNQNPGEEEIYVKRTVDFGGLK